VVRKNIPRRPDQTEQHQHNTADKETDMAITSITDQSLIASLGSLDTTDSTSSTDSSSLLSDLSDSSSSSSTSLTTFSELGKLFSSLSSLQLQSNASFKMMTASIASDFHTAASESSNTMQRLSLDSMASQFSNASITGSMSSINMNSVTGGISGYNAYQNNVSLLNSLSGSTTSTSSITDILSQNLSSVLV
jgi:hypothetical protein